MMCMFFEIVLAVVRFFTMTKEERRTLAKVTEESIDSVVAHVKIQHDIDVVFDDDELGAYYPAAGIIGINSTESLERQLFTLLHEAGHVTIRRDRGRFLNIDETTPSGKKLRLLE